MPPPLTADDRLDIIDLLARYAWAIDSGDVDAYVECFAPDAVLTMRGNINEGREAIRAYVSGVVSRPEFPGRQHHHSEVRIEGDGERCRVRSYSTITQRFEGGEAKIMFLGFYEDVVVKLDGRWFFASRTWGEWKA